MDSFLGRLKNPLVLLAVVVLQTLWLAIEVQRPLRGGISDHLAAAAHAVHGASPGAEHEAGSEARPASLLRRWTMFVVAPVERATHGTSLGVRRLWASYVDLRHTRERNVQLQAEVARLRLEQAAFAEDAAEGRRLQVLLEFKGHYLASTVAAQVIGTSGTDRSHVLWIDKGAADGLKPEQPVITPDGVVGKLREVMPHTAQLLLLSDPSSGAGVILVSTRLRGILRGTAAGEVEIGNLTPDERIKPGERVITSGGDQVFPRGLPVGVIRSVTPDAAHPPYTVIRIEPAANLRRLEEVLVVTGTEAALPPAASADAAQAEATAEENQRAADVVAARLPSLHDGAEGGEAAASAGAADGDKPDVAKAAAAAANTPGGVPGVPNSGMPKVRPALRGDRYSPGAAAPAAEMVPGGGHP